MRKSFIFLLLTSLLFSCGEKPASNISVSKMFTNHMVLQQEAPCNIWGTAAPKTEITISIDGKSVSTKADKNSKWITQISPFEAGGPYELTISTHDTSITYSDVLFGDVWICSGQSNMEWTLIKSNAGIEELKNMNYPNIRFIDIPKDNELQPLSEFRNDISWKAATSEEIAEFSAVGFYFGKELNKSLDIPIGLIGSNWGGTESESWTSLEGLGDGYGLDDEIEFVKKNTKTILEVENKSNKGFIDFKENIYYKGIGLDEKWYLTETDLKDWKKVEVPCIWEKDIKELEEFDGAVWFRTNFDIPAEFIGQNLKMWFGQILDHDMIWVNGEKVGEMFHKDKWRGYTVPASLLKEGENEVVIRIFNVYGVGGFKGVPSYFDYYPEVNKTGKVLSTSGTWKYKKGAELKDVNGEELLVNAVGPNTYTCGLYNAMINPMINFTCKGAIWYQGEANAGRAYQYRELFPALIKDWRNKWGQENFDFYWVQLANYMAGNSDPVDSEWAELREAQTMTLALEGTGMATIIDIGEAGDIHPTNKTDVGKRLALNALHTTYGKDIIYTGPTYASHEIIENKVEITFTSVGGGLVTSDKKAPVGFALAGEDNIFYWADAKIDGDKIILSSKKVDKPISIRYAWANNPETNLYNAEGLPANPFRTDELKGITFDRK